MPDESKRATCPSCRAEIVLGDDGKPVSHDVAHFDVHNATPEPATPETPATPDTPETPAPEPEPASWFDRIDQNLSKLLED